MNFDAIQPSGSNLLLGEFQFERELGRGGMGQVSLVRSVKTGRRFALKQALLSNSDQQKLFLAELQTWIDLPEHLNLLACRFFRTVSDQILIFADFCEGGSLAEWIADGRIETHEKKIDIAIQFARGIQAIHERGLVHQDIKPGNVLMTRDGIPRVADFGLSRARLHATNWTPESSSEPIQNDPVLVTLSGMTPAYASPEQRSGEKLSQKTDIWSWGVSVMDLFLGGVSCPHGGHIAGIVLDSLAESAEEISDQSFPQAIVDVLRRCFQTDPQQRWSSLAEIERVLVAAHSELLGSPYQDSAQKWTLNRPNRDSRSTSEHYTLKAQEWLSVAEALLGKHLQRREHIASTAKGALVESIRIMDEVVPVMERFIDEAEQSSVQRYFDAIYEAAQLHRRLTDNEGCLSKLRLAVQTLERRDIRRPAIRSVLANAHYYHAVALREFGRLEEAQAALNDALELYETQLDGLDKDAGSGAIKCLQTLSTILAEQGRNSEALKVFESVHGLLHGAGSESSRNTLALSYNNGAICARKCGELRQAAEWFEACVALRKGSLTSSPDDLQLRDDLAGTLGNLAAVLVELGDNEPALNAAHESAQYREDLLTRYGEPEMRVKLAKSIINRASVLFSMERWEEAVLDYGKAINSLVPVMDLEGRSDLSTLVNSATSSRDTALLRVEESSNDEADRLYRNLVTTEREAIKICASEIRSSVLARLLSNWAGVMRSANKPGSAWLMLEEAVNLFRGGNQSERLVEAERALFFSYRNLAVVLIDIGAFAELEENCLYVIRSLDGRLIPPVDGEAFNNYCYLCLCLVHAHAAQGQVGDARQLIGELCTLLSRVGTDFPWRDQVTEAIQHYANTVVPQGTSLNDPDLREYSAQCIAFEAQSYRSSGNLEMAIALYTKALLLQPNNLVAWVNLSVAYAISGRYSDALSCCDRGLQKFPQSAQLWFNRGRACFDAADYRGAALGFEQAARYGMSDAAGQAKQCWGLVNGHP